MSSVVARADHLAALVGEDGLGMLLVGDLVRPGDSGPDAIAGIRWLTGFGGTSGLALVGPEIRLFVTDARYEERAAREVDPGFERATAATRLLPVIAGRLRGRVGYDDAQTSVRILRKLSDEAPDGVELVAAAGLVERLRRTKDGGEIEAIAAASSITDSVYQWLCDRGFAGRTEREIAAAAATRMREAGAAGPSFAPIVAAGENSALPHHSPSDRVIREGELVLIDMGSTIDGYCSDATRTFAVGDVGDEEREVYEVVRKAQLAGLEAVRAGIGGREADAASRSVIEAAGYGERYVHGLGHGVGLEVHEAPRLGKTSEDVLAAGDVVSVEPGIYLPGRFGVRIEDLVVVEEGGSPRNLNSFTKELLLVS